jgi:hypothetical protein
VDCQIAEMLAKMNFRIGIFGFLVCRASFQARNNATQVIKDEMIPIRIPNSKISEIFPNDLLKMERKGIPNIAVNNKKVEIIEPIALERFTFL